MLREMEKKKKKRRKGRCRWSSISQLGNPEWDESQLHLKKHELCSLEGRAVYCHIVNAYWEMRWDVLGRPRKKHD